MRSKKKQNILEEIKTSYTLVHKETKYGSQIIDFKLYNSGVGPNMPWQQLVPWLRIEWPWVPHGKPR